jgi:hypothetical protein
MSLLARIFSAYYCILLLTGGYGAVGWGQCGVGGVSFCADPLWVSTLVPFYRRDVTYRRNEFRAVLNGGWRGSNFQRPRGNRHCLLALPPFCETAPLAFLAKSLRPLQDSVTAAVGCIRCLTFRIQLQDGHGPWYAHKKPRKITFKAQDIDDCCEWVIAIREQISAKCIK